MHPRFFLLPEGTRPGPDGTVALAGEEAVHLRRVLRLREGDRVHLADGTGWRAPARVRRIGAGRGNGPRVVLELAGPAEEVDDLVPVHLLVAVLKKEAMDWLVQKAAELGAARLQPVVTARTVVRLDSSRAGARLERWRGLARQALKQCRGGRVTEVAPVAPLEAALAACAGLPGRFFLWEGGGRPLARAWAELGRPLPCAVLVGPEGGFEAGEAARVEAAGFVPAGLGPRILRGETAAVAALAVLAGLRGGGAGP